MKNLILLTLCVTIFKNSEQTFFNQFEEDDFEKLESLILSQSSLIQELQRTIASQEDQVAVLEKKLEHEEQRVPEQRDTPRTHKNDRRQAVRTTTKAAFSAYLNESIFHLSSGDIVKYDKVLLNEGGHYNSFTGVFTSPVDGMYVFSFFIDQWGESTHLLASLVVDGERKVQGVANPTTNRMDVQGGNIVALRLRAGQHVWIANYHSDGHIWASDRNRYDTFSGFLLYQ